jgi:hypothetical protein
VEVGQLVIGALLFPMSSFFSLACEVCSPAWEVSSRALEVRSRARGWNLRRRAAGSAVEGFNGESAAVEDVV